MTAIKLWVAIRSAWSESKDCGKDGLQPGAVGGEGHGQSTDRLNLKISA
jgi:hypothetical protein